MATYDYVLLARRDVDACLAIARQAATQWEADWCKKSGMEPSCGEATMENIPSDVRWYGHRQTNGTTYWSFQSPGFAHAVQCLLFDLGNKSQFADGPSESSIALSIASEAAAELRQRLLHALVRSGTTVDVDGEIPPEWRFRRTAGSVLVQLTSAGQSMGILLPHSMLPKREKSITAARSAMLTPLHEVLSAKRVRLNAELDGVKLTLRQLSTLLPGDVLSLGHKLDQPLKIYMPTGHQAALAYLGKQDGQRALQLTAVKQK